MNHLGEFSTHTRDGDDIVKQLNAHHPAGSHFVTAVTRTGEAGMQSYLDALRSARVQLPRELHIVGADPLTIRHRWVAGPTLLDAPQADPAVLCAAIGQIGRWVQDLHHTDTRIDTNLANFCLSGDQPVLVDVLPPLIPNLQPEPENLFDELFGALCFDTPVILDALVGYALRTVLHTRNQCVVRGLVPVARELISHSSDELGFPASWFRARRVLAMRAAEGEAHPELVQDLFALTSVLRFRQLDETARRLRIEQVERRIRELRL